MSERLFLRLDEYPLAGPETTAPSGSLGGFDASAELRVADLAREYGFTDIDGRQVEAFEL